MHGTVISIRQPAVHFHVPGIFGPVFVGDRVHAETGEESVTKAVAVQQHFDRLRAVHDDAGAVLIDISVRGFGVHFGGAGNRCLHHGERVRGDEDDWEGEGAGEWVDKDDGGDWEGEVECEGKKSSDLL